MDIDKNRLARNVAQALGCLAVTDKNSPSGQSYLFVQNPGILEYRLLTQASLNNMWQSWNSFCRSFWVTYLVGGYSVLGFDMVAQAANHNCPTEVLLADFLSANSGYGQSRRSGTALQYYQEPTWGDPDKLGKALMGANQTAETLNMERALNQFGSDIKDLQLARNAAIHPSKGSIQSLKALVGSRYSVPLAHNGRLPYTLALAYSTKISSGVMAIKQWGDSLVSAAKVV